MTTSPYHPRSFVQGEVVLVRQADQPGIIAAVSTEFAKVRNTTGWLCFTLDISVGDFSSRGAASPSLAGASILPFVSRPPAPQNNINISFIRS